MTVHCKSLKLWHVDAGGSAACLLITAAVVLMGIYPLLRQQADAAAQENELEVRRQRISELAISLASVEGQLAEVRRELAESPLQLEPASRINRRLAAVADLAKDNGLKIDQVEPGQTLRGSRYETVKIRLGGTGSYQTCATFLHRLRRSFPDMGLVSMDLKGSPERVEPTATLALELLWYTTLTPEIASK